MIRVSLAAAVAIISIIVISGYSASVVNNFVASNRSTTVAFTLGAVYRDVPYCNSQLMDIYIPNATGSGGLPVAIYVHGGGLTSGDKSNIKPVFLNALASSGYIVASVNYRLAPQYKFPSQIDDVKCAVRFLRENAQKYGIDASEMVAFGDSSGGQLVSLMALTNSSTFDDGPYLNQSGDVQAVADMFGDVNLTGSSAGQAYRNQTSMILASPLHYVTSNGAPILIIQGTNDTNVPEAQSIQFYSDLKANGAQTELILVGNAGHELVQVGPNPISPSETQIAQDMVDFFNLHLGRGG